MLTHYSTGAKALDTLFPLEPLGKQPGTPNQLSRTDVKRITNDLCHSYRTGRINGKNFESLVEVLLLSFLEQSLAEKAKKIEDRIWNLEFKILDKIHKI